MSFVPIVPYADLTYANAYFAERLGSSAWTSAATSDQTAALATATRSIDTLNFAGFKHDQTYTGEVPNQPNQFPRGNDDQVPDDVIRACCELAISLLDDRDPEIEMENLATGHNGMGDARIARDTRLAQEHIAAGIVSLRAWNLLKPYLLDPGRIQVLRED